jgi:toxin-antitoxin system PIN domain toxin
MSEVPAWLPDVNVLIALMDPWHVHHEPAHGWWRGQPGRLWATCAITENGLIRVLTQPRYPNKLATVAEAVGLLRRWKATHASTHCWWAADPSLTDETLFQPEQLAGHGQVTDAYLLGLARRHGGRLVTFDRTVPWQALVSGSSDLVELLG